MCGIAGIISFEKKINIKEISGIINSIKHRGPDDHGHWICNDKKNLLVNTRLSIIDISKNGRQPIISTDKKHIIIFNH